MTWKRPTYPTMPGLVTVTVIVWPGRKRLFVTRAVTTGRPELLSDSVTPGPLTMAGVDPAGAPLRP